MSVAGLLILGGFFLFAFLMVKRILPAILALPLMAAWIALVAGLPLVVYVNVVLLGGAMKLASAIMVVIFGAMFARVILKTGISRMIIKKAAELAGDKKLSIAIVMTAATAFVFLGMSGLGAVIMVGSISIPIMISAGIDNVTASVLLLFGLQTGLLANAANYGAYMGIFGGTITASYYGPAVLISAVGTLIFILRNVRESEASGQIASLVGLVSALVAGLCAVLGLVVSALSWRHNKSGAGVSPGAEHIPALALVAPVLPLVTVFSFKIAVGFGKAENGQVDPIAASILGFVLAAVYAIILTRPRELVNICAGAIIEGIKDIASVIFLFMGIGMLVAVVMQPGVAKILNPFLQLVMPSSKWSFLLFFALLAPTALYRGPLNMFGMGTGIAVLIVSLQLVPPAVVAGAFLGVQYVQAASDPTNSHNTWIGGFANVDTTLLLKKTLPYTWGMCLVLLLYVALTRW